MLTREPLANEPALWHLPWRQQVSGSPPVCISDACRSSQPMDKSESSDSDQMAAAVDPVEARYAMSLLSPGLRCLLEFFRDRNPQRAV